MLCDIAQRSCHDLYIDTYIYICILNMIHTYNIYVYSEKFFRDDRKYRGEHCKEEGIGGAGRRWEGCTVEIHTHSVASYNGRMALVKRGKDHGG